MMKRIMWLVIFTVAAVLLGGGAAWADGDFYVIAGGGSSVGTKITSVPYTINSPGFYLLTGNLSVDGVSAITVNADNVTIDLMGFSLTNTGAKGNTKGIFMSLRSNVEVRNGIIRGFSVGIFENGDSSNQPASNHRAINVRTINNDVGINLYGKSHTINNCNCSFNAIGGIVIQQGIITNCIACNNGNYGILMFGPGIVLGNTACNNTTYNFELGNIPGGANSILVNNNSAFGKSINYYMSSGTTGVVITANNSGTP